MKRVGLWLAVWGSALALPCLALASEAEGGKAPFPQLDANQYPGLLFWLALTFPLLFVLMQFVAAPRVQRAQANRQQLLRNDLEAAEKDNEQAKTVQEAYEKALVEARAGAQAEISGIVAVAAEEEAKQRTVQQQELSHRLIEAERRIAVFRETALREGRQAAAELAEAIVGRLAGDSAAGRLGE